MMVDIKKLRIGFIGGGNIAKAICGGILKAGLVDSYNVIVSAPSQRSFAEWKSLGTKTTNSNTDVVDNADIVFLCMKPYQFQDAMSQIAKKQYQSILFVSTLSGTPIITLAKKLQEIFGDSTRLIRSMPNTPLLVGAGCTVLAPHSTASSEDVEMVLSIFRATGRCEIVAEHLISPVIGVAGSSPAFIYVIIEAMADAGVKGGLPRVEAQNFAAQAVMGAAKMVLESGQHPAQLKDAVCSPGGTTIYGIQALEKAGLRAAVMAAVEASTQRSEEMTKLYK